jgi:hypothetical protein
MVARPAIASRQGINLWVRVFKEVEAAAFDPPPDPLLTRTSTMIRQPAPQQNLSNRQSGRFTACARIAGIAIIAAVTVFGETARAASPDGVLADYTALQQALNDGLRIDSFLIPDGRYIAFIDEHRTLDPKNHPVTEYVRYHVMPDNTVTIDTAFAANGADTASSRGTYRCTINQGIRFIATASH